MGTTAQGGARCSAVGRMMMMMMMLKLQSVFNFSPEYDGEISTFVRVKTSCIKILNDSPQCLFIRVILITCDLVKLNCAFTPRYTV